MPSRNLEAELTQEEFLAKYLDDFSRDGYRSEWKAYLKARWEWLQTKNDPDAWRKAIQAYKQIPNRPNKMPGSTKKNFP